MEQIRIVRRRSRTVPIIVTLIVLALIVAAVLFLTSGGAVGQVSSLDLERTAEQWRQLCFSFAV
jgi:hypothetical protein